MADVLSSETLFEALQRFIKEGSDFKLLGPVESLDDAQREKRDTWEAIREALVVSWLNEGKKKEKSR